MIGLLARVLIGVVAVGVAGGAAYGVYKLITRETARNEIFSKVQDDDTFKNAFKARYEEKKEEAFSFTVMDEWDEPLGDITLYGDEISSDIDIGDEIIL